MHQQVRVSRALTSVAIFIVTITALSGLSFGPAQADGGGINPPLPDTSDSIGMDSPPDTGSTEGTTSESTSGLTTYIDLVLSAWQFSW